MNARLLIHLVIVLSPWTCALRVEAQEKSGTEPNAAQASAAKDGSARQVELEAKFAKAMSGATLEGSYTMSGAGGNGTKLRREKYTLGEVKKTTGNIWLFPARIEYGGKDVTLPIPLPVEWAGDTPVIIVDNVMLPGFGTVSARVLFFDGHYSGYWKHGDHSGSLFGEYHSVGENRGTEKADVPNVPTDAPSSSSSDPAAIKQSK